MSFENSDNVSPQMFCERHPTEEATLTCRGCNRRICTICLTLTGEGVRCPDCMLKLNAAYYKERSGTEFNTATPTAEIFSKQSNFLPKPVRTFSPKDRNIRMDTGFRTYWNRSPSRNVLEPQLYIKALLAAVGTAVILGVIWGNLLQIPRSISFTGSNFYFSNWQSLAVTSYQNSIHFLPEILIGVAVAEVVARVSLESRGKELQFIAIAGVLISYFLAVATLVVRIYLAAGVALPDPGIIFSNTWSILNTVFTRGGVGILVFWIIGTVMAGYRLKR